MNYIRASLKGGSQIIAYDMPTRFFDAPPRNASMATIEEMLSNLKVRASGFLPVTLLKFLIPEQIRPDLLGDQIHKTIAN
jgi:hypothetical protein